MGKLLVKNRITKTYELITAETYAANPSKYIDRSSSPTYWMEEYLKVGLTYWQVRYIIDELVSSLPNQFNSLRSLDKEVASILGLGYVTSIIPFLMSYHGVDQTQASSMVLNRVANDISNRSKDAQVIIHSPKMIVIGVKYLTKVLPDGSRDASQANNLTYAIQGFLTEYERYGLLGLNYYDERAGLMDYFESTNDYASGGLKNYEFNPEVVSYLGSEDQARLSMIAELKELFVKGIY